MRLIDGYRKAQRLLTGRGPERDHQTHVSVCLSACVCVFVPALLLSKSVSVLRVPVSRQQVVRVAGG